MVISSLRRILAGAAIVALTAGCSNNTDAVVDTKAAEINGALGQNLAGEACSAALRRDDSLDPGAPPPLEIFCGAGRSLAGVVHASRLASTLPESGTARRDAIERTAHSTPGAFNIAARMTCRAGQWLDAGDGNEASIAPCTLRDGDWPQIVLTVPIGTTLYQAEGLPVMLPVFQRAISAASGRRFDLGEVAAGVERLSTLLDTALTTYSNAELIEYNELIRSARLYNAGGNSAEAEAAYRRALDIQTRIFGESASGVGAMLAALALEVSNQKRYEEAGALFRRAEPIIERSPNVLDRARLFAYQALDAANQRHFADALQYARQATALRRGAVEAPRPSVDGGDPAEVLSSSRGEIAHSLSIEAAMALRLGDLPSAEAAATEALGIISELPDVPQWWRPNALTLVGQIEAQQGRLTAAERNFAAALAFRRRLFGDTAPAAQSYLALGRLYVDEELFPAAVRAYRSAFEILAKDRTARAEFAVDQLTPFLAAASALAERDPQETEPLDAEMFRAVQLTGTGVEAQTIERASARLATDDSTVADLIRQTQEAQRRRDSASIELATETTKPDEQRGSIREAALMQEVTRASSASETLLRQLQAAFPAYGRLANPGPAELDEVQAKLGKDEALVTFVVGREQSYGILVRSDGFVVHRLELNEVTLAAAVDDLRRSIVPRLGTVPDFDQRDAYALYKRLLGPFDDGLTGANHLIVVAAGPLASLPFGMLITRTPVQGHDRDYAGAAWLVRRLAASQVPSIRAFVSLRRAPPNRVRPTHAFLGFGNPAFVGDSEQSAAVVAKGSALDELARYCRDNGPMPASRLKALAPLPETAGEVRTIARLLGAGDSSVYLGLEATEGKLRSLPLDQYRILFFATHGLLPGELRCQSEPGIALSPPLTAAVSKSEDGFLDASEIAGLKLNADLVVLSACNTATGAGRFGGEALSGLAEAFFYAGARTLVASHWQVPSIATVRLMTGMFERIGPDGSISIADALRRSQLAVLEQSSTAHPFYWAAFTVIGDGAGPHAARTVAAASRDNDQ
jgi:CHAT domain-containing protein